MQVFRLLIDGIQHMDSLMTFTSDPRLGWLTFCPTNLGTAIRASVHITLPLLARGGMAALQEVADQWQLQVRATKKELELFHRRCEDRLENTPKPREVFSTSQTGDVPADLY